MAIVIFLWSTHQTRRLTRCISNNEAIEIMLMDNFVQAVTEMLV